MYTHSLVARTFFCAQRAHCVLRTLLMRVTYTHGSRFMKKRCLSRVCRFSPSRLLPSHVSLVFAVPAHPLRHHVPVHLLAALAGPKSAGHAQLRTCIAKFGYLAKSETQVMSPTSSTRSLLWTMTRCSLTTQTSMKSLTPRKTTNENTRQLGVPTMFESSVSHVSHDDLALQIESKESMKSGNRCQTERKRRKKFLRSVLQSRCRRKVNGTVSV